MVVTKRQGREKPAKIEQRKVWGLEWGLQVEHTALLAIPICIGQPQGEGKTYKKRSQRALSCACTGAFFSSRIWVDMPLHFEDGFSCYYLKKNRAVTQSCNIDLSKSYHTVHLRLENYNTVCPRPKSCDTLRALMSLTPNLCCGQDRTVEHSLAWQNILISTC